MRDTYLVTVADKIPLFSIFVCIYPTSETWGFDLYSRQVFSFVNNIRRIIFFPYLWDKVIIIYWQSLCHRTIYHTVGSP